MENRKDRIKSFVGGLILGLIVGGLWTLPFLVKIIESIDVCNKMDCIRYQKLDISR